MNTYLQTSFSQSEKHDFCCTKTSFLQSEKHDKKYTLQIISLYELLINFMVFTLFVYGMVKDIIRPAFGIFVAGPAFFFAFSALAFFILMKDQQFIKEHKYYQYQGGVRFVFGVINMISCINPDTKTMYWIHNEFTRDSFFIYFVSSIILLIISNYYIKIDNEIHNNNKNMVRDIVNDIIDNIDSEKSDTLEIDV